MRMAGLKVAISASDAPDRARLGMPTREVDRALLTICTTLVREGCDIIYAGNLAPDKFTFKIFRHLAGAYAGGRIEAPFLHVIAEPVARQTSFDALHAALRESGVIARTRISIGGHLVPVRTSGAKLLLGEQGAAREIVDNDARWTAWLDSHPKASAAEAYTSARTAMTEEADARVALGGKMGVLANPNDNYEGVMPGIVEEAVMSLNAGQPLVALGAYGGASRDVTIALGLLPVDRTVPRGDQQPGYADALARVAALAYQVPDAQRPVLEKIADDDRGELTSFLIVEAILGWRGIR